MEKIINVRVDHPAIAPGPIRDFRFFWAFWVGGFNQATHCQMCFTGRRVKEFCSATAQSGRQYSMPQPGSCRYLYICGVGAGPKHKRRERNFHLALEYSEDARLQRSTYNGYSIEVHNAIELPIPELPENWRGRNLATTRCKNFRFAVEYFGYTESSPSSPLVRS